MLQIAIVAVTGAFAFGFILCAMLVSGTGAPELGSQRALKTVEDFAEFEQRGAYFDGDPVIATKKGVNILERGSQVHFMAEFQKILDFPPAPKLDVSGSSTRRRRRRPSCGGKPSFSARAPAPAATCRSITPIT